MKGISLLLLAVVVVLGVYAYRQTGIITAQQGQLATLTSRASTADDRARPASLDLQAKCAEQARKAFVQSGFKATDGAGYENHYNTKLNKCFVDVQNTSTQAATVWTYRNVYDAFEGKPYGTYAWRTVGDKKYWEVAPVICEVTSPTGEKQLCHSDKEFAKLIKVYMNVE